MESPSRGHTQENWTMNGERAGVICVVHYLPVEEYPPLQNLMVALRKQKRLNVVIFTGSLETRSYHLQSLAENIIVFFFPYLKAGGWRQKLDFAMMVRKESVNRSFDCVFAFGDEFSGLVCSRMNSKIKALHLHELPPQIGVGNKFLSKSLFFELVLLHFTIKRFKWISQVTPRRAELFSKRFQVQCRHLYNFPSARFESNIRGKRVNGRLRIIYVGSCNPVSVQVSILKRLSMSKLVELSVLATNKQGLEQVAGLTGTQLLSRVPYSKLPNLLRQFDVGLVLYNGHSDNMRYGVPNKLIEYLRCGLHVVYPSALESVTDFVSAHNLTSVIHVLPMATEDQIEYIENDVNKFVRQSWPRIQDFTFEQEYQQFFDFLSNENPAVNAE